MSSQPAIRQALEGTHHCRNVLVGNGTILPAAVEVTSLARPPVAIEPLQEPVLETREIQGNVLVGFNADYQTLVFLHVADAADAKRWLRTVAASVTSAQELLERRHPGERNTAATWVNLAFSFGGLRKLIGDAHAIFDEPFKLGLPARSRVLGDPVEPDAGGYCGNWIVGGPDAVPDILMIIAGNDRERVADRVAQLGASLPPTLRPVHCDHGMNLPAPLRGCEHFGFRDPVSQPGIRGRLSRATDDFLTPRQNPANSHHGKPGQNLIWPGEFVFGYPGQSALDLVRPGIVADAGPSWGRNGSLLVFRRLNQDVAAFHDFLRSTAAQLARQVPTLAGISPEWLGARLLGRWQSGASVLGTPTADDCRLAADEHVNDFRFVAAGDALGLVCPQAAHIRKAYPRDHPAPIDTVASIETHRIIRRGIPFGPAFPEPGERGLLFLAYQTSIERQFEFITRAWLNNPRLREEEDGHDPITGQSIDWTGNRVRYFTLAVRDRENEIQRVRIELPAAWVTPTGGGYFFVPSSSAIDHFAS
jgi:Dyp-type peroxidase family